MRFRTLDAVEEAELRQCARENYTPLSAIEGIWHPVIQDECRGRRICLGSQLPASQPDQGSKPMILRIGNRASFNVSTFAEASLTYARYRDASLEGASTFPDGIILDGTRTIARVSYNAKVWPPGMRTQSQIPLFDPYSR
jgi:hypothetical protein